MRGKETKRAVAYIRVSAVMGREELISPELQRHEIEQYAKRNGLSIAAEVQDIDKSGRSFTKRRVGEVIRAIEAGEYSTVILWKWSRWGRNLRESLIHLATVEAAGGSVRAATEDFDQSTSVGRFTRDQMLLIAQLQSDQIGDGWRETHAKRRRDGLPHTSQRRFGYRYDRKAREYQPNPVEAAVLASLYERAANGAPIRGLATELNERGIRTTRGGYWTATALRKVLDTGFGAGLIRWRTDTKSGEGINAFDKWEKGAHEAIISQEVWDAYYARRLAGTEMPARLRVATHALSGLLHCGICEDAGRVPTRLVTTYGGHGAHRWICPRGKMAKVHAPLSIGNAEAMAEVLAWVESEIGERENASVTAGAARRARERRKAEAEVDRQAARIDHLARRRKNLTRQLADAVDGVEEADVRELLAEVAVEIESAKLALATAKAESGDASDELVEMFRGLRAEWDEFEPNDHRAALSALLAAVTVYPGPTLRPLPHWLAPEPRRPAEQPAVAGKRSGARSR